MPLKRSEKATKSRQKRCLFGGGRHGSSVVNSSKNLLFRVFEQAPFLYHFWLRFGLHFGGVLGAKCATILLFGRRSRQKDPHVGTFWPMWFLIPFFMDFECQGDLQEGSRRRGRGTSGCVVILHLGPWRMILPCVFEDSVQRPLRSPKDKSLK